MGDSKISRRDGAAVRPCDDLVQRATIEGLRDAIVNTALDAIRGGADGSGVLFAVVDAAAILLAAETREADRADVIAAVVETFPEQVAHAAMDLATPPGAAAGHA